MSPASHQSQKVKARQMKEEKKLQELVKLNSDTLKQILDYDEHFLKENDFESEDSEKHCSSDGGEYGLKPNDSNQELAVTLNQIKPNDGFTKAQQRIIKQFPTFESNQFDVMYDRAMKQLRYTNRQQQIDDAEVQKKNNLNLFHFHIEAFNDHIAINRISPQREDPMEANLKRVDDRVQAHDLATKETTIQAELAQRRAYRPMLKIQTGFHPALRAGEASVVSKDLMGVSPDIKKFASQKRSMLAYMQQVKDNEEFTLEPQLISPFGEDYDDNASAAGLTNYSYHRGITKISHLLEGVSQNERRTLLRTREVDDNIPDYLKMDVAKFRKLSPQEVADAYKQIKKATKTVFSGTVDPLVNILDYSRVKSKLSRNALCNQNEMDIIEELVKLRKSLDNRALMVGMWDNIDTVGSTPDSREGASACLMGNKIFVFGGFSRLLFKDIRYIDTSDYRWKMIVPTPSTADPPGRYNHSMCQFASRYLIIFGGAGHYMKSMGVRQCMNDLFILDTELTKWTKIQHEQYTPGIRMNHVAASLGSLMLVQGGYNSETKKTYRDIHLFDIQT